MKLSTLALSCAVAASICAFACSTDPGGEVLIMEVAPAKGICVGLVPQYCLLTRTGSTQEFGFEFDGIDGFNYQWGFRYVLSVERFEISNPPADASSEKLIHLATVTKTAVDAGTEFELSFAPGDLGDGELGLVRLNTANGGGTIDQDKSFTCIDADTCTALQGAIDADAAATLRFSFQDPPTEPVILEEVTLVE